MITLNYKLWRGRSGIYGIRHIPSKRIYIGQAQDIGGRWSVHLATLRLNSHHCYYLQNLWNKYPEDEFEFRGLQFVSTDELNKAEIKWCSRFQELLLNIHPPGGVIRGFKHREEVKARMKVSAKRASNTPEQRKMRSERAKRQHEEGNIPARQLIEPVKVCTCCGNPFNRYKLTRGYHNGRKCLVCMAVTFASQGGRFNLDQFQIDQDEWDYAAYELTWNREYNPEVRKKVKFVFNN